MYRFLEMRVADYMTTPAITVTPDTTLTELEGYLTEHDFNGFPVRGGRAPCRRGHQVRFLKVFVFTPRMLLPHYELLRSCVPRRS